MCAPFPDDLTSSATVLLRVLDTNDNLPLFYPQQYDVTIARSTSVQSEVVVVRATDQDDGDFGRVRYSITSGSNGVFAIDEDSGVIRLTSSLGASVRSVELRVAAVDGGDMTSPINAFVSVTVVDSLTDLPQFTQTVYDFILPEDSDVDQSVGSVQAQFSSGSSSILFFVLNLIRR